jgi:D-serine deaminase-like pyridoxal phosphate-dependent protein
VLYGLPVAASVIPTLDHFSKSVQIRVLVDHPDHLDLLAQYSRSIKDFSKRRSVFVKLDMGSRRAGIPPDSQVLKDLIRMAENMSCIQIYGFYTHAGHSYSGSDAEQAQSFLWDELNAVLMAANHVSDVTTPLVLSVGASPTARVVESAATMMKKQSRIFQFEIHAGI